jgi:hypothetical protein
MRRHLLGLRACSEARAELGAAPANGGRTTNLALFEIHIRRSRASAAGYARLARA